MTRYISRNLPRSLAKGGRHEGGSRLGGRGERRGEAEVFSELHKSTASFREEEKEGAGLPTPLGGKRVPNVQRPKAT